MGLDDIGWPARGLPTRPGCGCTYEIAQRQRENTFITSLHAYTPRNLPHYSATKAGQTMIVKELARALGVDGIRVNAIAPGAIPGGGFDASIASFAKMIPLGRTGTPEDVADMAVALLCDRFSRYVTGATFVVDGGLSLYNWIPVRAEH